MIYFDNDKNAFAFEIKNSIASVSEDVWIEYAGTDKWDIIDGTFCDITETSDYINKKEQEQIATQNEVIQNELKLLDKKRIRAIAEPELKNPDTGETWLEFYNAQIKNLRSKLIL